MNQHLSVVAIKVSPKIYIYNIYCLTIVYLIHPIHQSFDCINLKEDDFLLCLHLMLYHYCTIGELLAALLFKAHFIPLY